MFIESDSIPITLTKNELWTIHDFLPLHIEMNGKPVGYTLLMRVWEGILSCEDGDTKIVDLLLTEEECICIAGFISSNASEHARKLLVKVMRGIWQLKNRIRLEETEPDYEEAREKLAAWREELHPTEVKVKNASRAAKAKPRQRPDTTTRPPSRAHKPKD